MIAKDESYRWWAPKARKSILMVSNDADSIKRVNSREEAVWLLNLDFALGGILNGESERRK